PSLYQHRLSLRSPFEVSGLRGDWGAWASGPRDGLVNAQRKLLDEFVQSRFLDDEGGRDQNMVPLQPICGTAAGVADQAILKPGGPEKRRKQALRLERRLGDTSGYELQRQEEPTPANIADVGVFAERGVQT